MGAVLFSIHLGELMKKLLEFRRKYISSELPIRLCIFNMMNAIGIVSAVVSIIVMTVLGEGDSQIWVICAAIPMLFLFLYLANSKNKLNLAAVLLCCIIGVGVMPLMFWYGGGVYSGMPIWFMLVIVFSAILIEGRMRYVVCGILLTLYVAVIIFAFVFRDTIVYFETEGMVFTDVALSILCVGLCIVSIISFQIHMYEVAQKRIEEANKEAEKAREEAIAANNAKSSFLANMSHEIRTPIGVIVGMNEMIRRESNQETVVDYSKDVSSSANTLLSIINDILDFSKIESGKMNLVEAEYNLGSLLRDVINMARVKTEETGLEFETKIDDNLPCVLYGDDLRIKECLINIVTNAFKYTEKGKITLEVKGIWEGDYEKIEFSVTDTGRGIKEEEKEKLFESFVRLDEKKNKNIQGTGLGLNITNNLLKLMGSKLEVESEFGVGSKFFFSINQQIIDITPLKRKSDIDEKDKQTVERESVFSAPEARLLVVDDSEINLKVFCALLKQTKVKIDTAKCGYNAIEALKNNKYDMIFLDHMMPEMDGEEVLTKIREEKLAENIPVIMLTANALAGMKEHFIEVGFTDYLSKPIEYPKLEEMLRTYLKG